MDAFKTFTMGADGSSADGGPAAHVVASSTRRASAAPRGLLARDAAHGRAILASRYTSFLLDVAARHGLDRAAMFGDRAVYVSDVQQLQWSHDDLGVVLNNLRLATNDELCGLAPGVRVPPGTFKFACELVARSDTLGEGLRQAFRLYDLMGGLRFRLETDGDLACISVETPPMSKPDAAYVVEWWLWVWHYATQWLIRSEIMLERMDFPHDPIVDAETYDGTFGSKCFFGRDKGRIVFPSRDLDRPVSRSVDELAGFLAGSNANLRYSPDVARSAATSVKMAILGRLHAGAVMPTLEELAEEQGVTGQTLRRWLVAEGVSYRRLKAEMRCQVARHHVAWSDMTVDELAARSGFAEASAFARAFRAWTGMSVSEFRRRQRSLWANSGDAENLMAPLRNRRDGKTPWTSPPGATAPGGVNEPAA
jgi:AraC-like DNA-binding protein